MKHESLRDARNALGDIRVMAKNLDLSVAETLRQASALAIIVHDVKTRPDTSLVLTRGGKRILLDLSLF